MVQNCKIRGLKPKMCRKISFPCIGDYFPGLTVIKIIIPEISNLSDSQPDIGNSETKNLFLIFLQDSYIRGRFMKRYFS